MNQAKLVLEEKSWCSVKPVMLASTLVLLLQRRGSATCHCHSPSCAYVSFALKMVQSCMSDADFTKHDLTDFGKQIIVEPLSPHNLENSVVSSASLLSTDGASSESLPGRELRFSVLVIIKKKSQNGMANKNGMHVTMSNCITVSSYSNQTEAVSLKFSLERVKV